MKLNVKRTLLVGLAFLSISAFWQLYDFVVPLVLKNTYQLGDTLSGIVMAMDNIVALVLLPLFGALSDRCTLKLGRRQPFIIVGTALAVTIMLCMPGVIRTQPLGVFLACLALLLISMGTYRSPAVALMPDVTPKPLRSKGNAIINLMGAIGGVFTLILVNFAVVRTTDEAGVVHSDYTWLFVLVAALMIICVTVLIATIRERKLVAEADAVNATLTEEKKTEVKSAPGKEKLEPAVMRSLILILCSVSLWFMGYNAVTSAFSKYAITVWGAKESAAANCVLVATVFAIISYWPVGVISSRIGRKKMIQIGISMLAVGFLVGAFLPEMNAIMYIIFALVGAGWASINVNSFPMVVEMATGADTGKYTGYYYTFSMAAQVLTPILSGALLEHVGYWTLFPYAALCVAGSFVTMCFVKHGDSRPEAKGMLESLDAGDD